MNVTAAQLGQPNVSQEYLLLNYVQRLDRHRDGRKAVHVHLSNLRDHNRRGHHLRIAGNTFEGLVNQFEGQMFALNSGDLVFICKGASVEEMDDAINRLRYLFSDDPLAMADVADNFSTWYNLEAQYKDFVALAETLNDAEQARQERLRMRASQWGEDEASNNRPPITPTQLGKLENFLKSADLSSFVRRQQVCAVSVDTHPKPIFKELFISIDELASTVLPEANLAGNKWLFQHLTIALDDRVLKLLVRADDTDLHSSFSINMNVSTVLSQSFLDFDSQLRTGSRGTIVIEFQLIDVFADLAEFNFARDFLHEKGYRLCLDGISHSSLPVFDRKTLGLDLVKMIWDKSLIDEDQGGEKFEALRQSVEECGRSRIVMTRCDLPAAIEIGHLLGITMFQGRYVDALIQEKARFGNTAA